ncbi:hypothetical protein BD770DRAFT_76155 [Pilaira anomala]|nr:hypothetical protein BD770DRAFT_76155 [Pilaira anomala]
MVNLLHVLIIEDIHPSLLGRDGRQRVKQIGHPVLCKHLLSRYTIKIYFPPNGRLVHIKKKKGIILTTHTFNIRFHACFPIVPSHAVRPKKCGVNFYVNITHSLQRTEARLQLVSLLKMLISNFGDI